MKRGKYVLFLLLGIGTNTMAQFPTTRQAELWPFAQNSIWNMPIGDEAEYLPAQIASPQARPITVDEDILILKPDAPLRPVYRHDAGWSDRLRCESVLDPREILIEQVPIPSNFATDPGYLGLRPNHSAAILAADGQTLVQTQPFHLCGADGLAVSQYRPPNDDLYTGDGIRGAHGGSGMSSIGGTLRLGELVPAGVIRHALKINLYAKKYLAYRLDETPGYRWPAIRADGYANAETYGGQVPDLEMGALLALLPSFDLDQLQTAPARILAQALIDYGAYVVDDTAWDVFAITTEWGPAGRVIDEFEENWGYPMEITDAEHPWAKDVALLFTSLQIVTNNSMDRIGGGGVPRQPLAPAFALTSVGQEREVDGEVRIFPNPVQGSFRILWRGRGEEQQQVSLWDLHGRLQQSWRIRIDEGESRPFVLKKSLPSGLYILEIRDEQGRSLVKKLQLRSSP